MESLGKLDERRAMAKEGKERLDRRHVQMEVQAAIWRANGRTWESDRNRIP